MYLQLKGVTLLCRYESKPEIISLTGMDNNHIKLVLRSMPGRSGEPWYPPTRTLARIQLAIRVPPKPKNSTNLFVCVCKLYITVHHVCPCYIQGIVPLVALVGIAYRITSGD